VANKPAKPDEAEAYEANNVKADEADAKVDEANKAIVSDEIEASVIGKFVEAGEAIVIDKVIAVDKAILDNAANKAIVANKANDSDNEADGVLDNQLTEL
jgi:hypothetical protein